MISNGYLVTKLNKGYAHIVHKYCSVYKYVYAIIGCMCNIPLN